MSQKIWWTLSLRGRRSRNKVSVGEPAEGSFAQYSTFADSTCSCSSGWHWINQKLSGGFFHFFGLEISTLQNVFNVIELVGIGNDHFWRSMSWPKKRWRAQRSAINIANCRYPWTNWVLNAKCACKSLSASWPTVLFRMECSSAI